MAVSAAEWSASASSRRARNQRCPEFKTANQRVGKERADTPASMISFLLRNEAPPGLSRKKGLWQWRLGALVDVDKL